MKFKKMERMSTFASGNDHDVNELPRVEDIDHVIMKVTEGARRLSEESEHVDDDIISPERRGAEYRSYLRSVEGKGRAKTVEATASVNDHTDWYDFACVR